MDMLTKVLGDDIINTDKWSMLYMHNDPVKLITLECRETVTADFYKTILLSQTIFTMESHSL